MSYGLRLQIPHVAELAAHDHAADPSAARFAVAALVAFFAGATHAAESAVAATDNPFADPLIARAALVARFACVASATHTAQPAAAATDHPAAHSIAAVLAFATGVTFTSTLPVLNRSC